MRLWDAKRRTALKKKRRTGWIWILILLLGAGAFYKFYYLPKMQAGLAPEKQYSEYALTRSDVSVTVTGSGLLEPLDTEEETVIAGLKIADAVAKEGDRIEEGDILYTLDPDTLDKRILAVSQDLAGYRRSLARYSSSDAVYAPGAARVKVVYAKAGDRCEDVILREGCLAVLSADELMAVEIVSGQKPAQGETLRFSFTQDGRAYTEQGTVEKLTASGFIAVFPDTAALPGVQVSVALRDGTTLGTGEAYIHMPLYVYNTEGVIKSVEAKPNISVTTGSKLFLLAEETPSDSYLQAVRDREESAEELEKLLHYKEDPVIRAKNAGTLAKLALSVNSVTAKDVSIATVHTGGAVKMTVDIDETDIPGLRVGQKAAVTLDAYPGVSFPASVTRLPVIGVQSGSITVYKAELTLESDERLMEGMHGSAVITLESHENVLTVPVVVLEEDAEGAYALVAPAGEKKYVKTGISDGTVTEITEGLSEGDVLLYIPRGGTDMVTKMMERSQQTMAYYGG